MEHVYILYLGENKEVNGEYVDFWNKGISGCFFKSELDAFTYLLDEGYEKDDDGIFFKNNEHQTSDIVKILMLSSLEV